MGEPSSSSSSCLLSVDEFYFSILLDDEDDEDDDIFPIADDRYAEALQLQEALMSCTIANSPIPLIVGSTSEEEEENHSINSKLKQQEFHHHKEVGMGGGVVVVLLERESDSKSFCEICMEAKLGEDMFSINDCCHSFCSECISKHVAAKIQDNINSVTCPGLNCKRVLEPHTLQSIIPQQVFDRWMNALLESLILASQKFYCPYQDCSAMLVNDGEEIVRESECPYCRRLFCAQCKVPWHSEMVCEEFQRLDENDRGRDDLKVIELAKDNKWMKCPNCKFYVEKKDGCLHINCRCGFQFCYGCGSQWTQTHSC